MVEIGFFRRKGERSQAPTSHLGFLSPWGMRSCEVQCISPGSRPPGLLGKGTITLPVLSLPLYTGTPTLDAESMGYADESSGYLTDACLDA